MLATAKDKGDMRAIIQLEGMQAERLYIIGLYLTEGAHDVNNYLADQSRQVLYQMLKTTVDQGGNLGITATSTAVNVPQPTPRRSRSTRCQRPGPRAGGAHSSASASPTPAAASPVAKLPTTLSPAPSRSPTSARLSDSHAQVDRVV